MSRLSRVIIVGTLTGLLGLAASLTLSLSEWEESLGLGLLFRLRGSRQAPSEVVVVTIDSESAERFDLPREPGQWPRSLHAYLTENLVKAGAAVIAFDVIFEESRSEPEDAALEQAIKEARTVVLCECLRTEDLPLADLGGGGRSNLNIEMSFPPLPRLAQWAAASAPFPLPKVPMQVRQYWTFKTSAAGTPTLPVVIFQVFALDVYQEFVRVLRSVAPAEAANLPPDRQGVLAGKHIEQLVRVLRDLFRKDPSIAARMQSQLEHSEVLNPDARSFRILRSLIRMYQSPDNLYLNFYGPPGTIATVPYYQALESWTPKSPGNHRFDFRGKAVLVGLSERLRPEQKDGFYTVFSQSTGAADMSGVEIAATAFANLLEDIPVRPLGRLVHITLVLAWGMVLGVCCGLLAALPAAAGATVMCAVYLYAALYRFTATGAWYPLIAPLFLQAPFAFFSSVLWQYADTSTERRRLRKAFGYYLPNRVVDEIVRNIGHITASNQLVYGTCLFTDMEQYATLSETMHPQDLGSLMNKYYETVFLPVKQHCGVVSDVIGDSMLAIWATTHPDCTLRNQACQAALDIAKGVRQFNDCGGGAGQMRTRIGLHSGQIWLGNIGAVDHYEYRPVGDVVNTAARIESLNKHLGTGILVSGEVLWQLDGFITRELGLFRLAGKSKPVSLYELLGRLEESNGQQKMLCEAFAEALSAYRKRSWKRALKLFREAMKIAPQDGPSVFYARVCRNLRQYPPDEAWDGCVYLDRK